MNVLLLNASFEPLTVISNRRAVSLMLNERVDAACSEQTALRSPSTVLHIPRVLRLRRYVHVPRRGARWSRHAVFRRDNWTCIYCGAMPGTVRGGRSIGKHAFTIDHIVPRSRGGRNTWGNTACACAPCNGRKGNRLPHEAGMRLRWEPKRPRVDYLVASGQIPESWKLYLEL